MGGGIVKSYGWWTRSSERREQWWTTTTSSSRCRGCSTTCDLFSVDAANIMLANQDDVLEVAVAPVTGRSRAAVRS